MNLMSQLCNICKCTGTKFRFNISNRRWSSSNSASNVVNRMKQKDGVDEKFQLIYRPPHDGLLMVGTSFCSVSSVICPSMLGTFAFDYMNERNTEFVQQVSSLELAATGAMAIMSMIAAFVCTSIPLRIYNHEKEYIAILPSYIPMVKRKFPFEKGSIEDKNKKEWARPVLDKVMTPGFETASFYKIKNKRILLTIKCFDKPIQFYDMFANSKKYIRKLQPKEK